MQREQASDVKFWSHTQVFTPVRDATEDGSECAADLFGIPGVTNSDVHGTLPGTMGIG